MNYNTKNIIRTYAAITGIRDEDRIVKVLSKSPTFMAVRRGNPVLMYEGHSANLLEIVEELKSQSDCPSEVKSITSENIAIVNRTRRMDSMKRKRKGHFSSFFKRISRSRL